MNQGMGKVVVIQFLAVPFEFCCWYNDSPTVSGLSDHLLSP